MNRKRVNKVLRHFPPIDSVVSVVVPDLGKQYLFRVNAIRICDDGQGCFFLDKSTMDNLSIERVVYMDDSAARGSVFSPGWSVIYKAAHHYHATVDVIRCS